MGVYFVKDRGKYRAEIMIGGKRRTRIFCDEQEALDWFKEKKAQRGRAANGKADCRTFGELIKLRLRWMKHNRAPEAPRMFNLAMRRCLDWKNRGSLTLADLEERKYLIAEQISRQEANRWLKYLRGMLRWGHRMGYWPDRGPVDLIKSFPPAECNPRVYKAEELKRLRERLPDDRMTRDFMLVLLYTLSRHVSIRKLRWDDVDFAEGCVTLRHRKGQGCIERWYKVPMCEELREVLQRRLGERNGSPWVFPHQRGHPKPMTYTPAILERACKAAGVPFKGYHAIRRGLATMLYHKNVHVRDIQALLGHGDLNTTMRYLRVSDDRKEQSIGKLQRFLLT